MKKLLSGKPLWLLLLLVFSGQSWGPGHGEISPAFFMHDVMKPGITLLCEICSQETKQKIDRADQLRELVTSFNHKNFPKSRIKALIAEYYEVLLAISSDMERMLIPNANKYHGMIMILKEASVMTHAERYQAWAFFDNMMKLGKLPTSLLENPQYGPFLRYFEEVAASDYAALEVRPLEGNHPQHNKTHELGDMVKAVIALSENDPLFQQELANNDVTLPSWDGKFVGKAPQRYGHLWLMLIAVVVFVCAVSIVKKSRYRVVQS